MLSHQVRLLERLTIASKSTYRFCTQSGIEIHGLVQRPFGISRGITRPVVVWCGSHPQHNYSFEHAGLSTLCDTASFANLISFRFNYRGVSPSGGSRDTADVDRLDVIEVLKEVVELYPQGIVLGGIEYGAFLAGSVLNSFPLKHIHGFIAVNYPFCIISKFHTQHALFVSVLQNPAVKNLPMLFVRDRKDTSAHVNSEVTNFFQDPSRTTKWIEIGNKTSDHGSLPVNEIITSVGPWIAELCGTYFSTSTSLSGYRR